MGYDYERTASTLDALSKAATQRIDVLVQISTLLDSLERRGVNFDSRDRQKLDKARGKAITIGDASAKGAERLASQGERNEVTEDVQHLAEIHLREWERARTTQLTERAETTSHVQFFNGNATLGAAAMLNIDIIDFARAAKLGDPDMISIRDEVMRRFR